MDSRPRRVLPLQSAERPPCGNAGGTTEQVFALNDSFRAFFAGSIPRKRQLANLYGAALQVFPKEIEFEYSEQEQCNEKRTAETV